MDESLSLAATEIELADQAWRAALLLRDHGLARSSVAQSYYAAFHAVNALLVAHGLRPTTHDVSQTLFGLHFVKSGAVDPRLGKTFAQLYSQRLIADYKGVVELSPQDAAEAIESARALLRAALHRLRPRVAPAPAIAARVEALLNAL